jgi:hypothetical protein
MKELTGFPSRTADLSDGLKRVTIEDRDVIVRAVRNIQEALLRITGERDPICRARTGSLPPPHIAFLNERAAELEHLDPVVSAVRDINQVIIRNRNAAHGIELRAPGPESSRLNGALSSGLLPYAPSAACISCIRVENNYATVSVTVGHEQLIGFLVDDDSGRPTYVSGIVAVGFHSGVPDLQ